MRSDFGKPMGLLFATSCFLVVFVASGCWVSTSSTSVTHGSEFGQVSVRFDPAGEKEGDIAASLTSALQDFMQNNRRPPTEAEVRAFRVLGDQALADVVRIQAIEIEDRTLQK